MTEVTAGAVAAAIAVVVVVDVIVDGRDREKPPETEVVAATEVIGVDTVVDATGVEEVTTAGAADVTDGAMDATVDDPPKVTLALDEADVAFVVAGGWAPNEKVEAVGVVEVAAVVNADPRDPKAKEGPEVVTGAACAMDGTVDGAVDAFELAKEVAVEVRGVAVAVAVTADGVDPKENPLRGRPLDVDEAAEDVTVVVDGAPKVKDDAGAVDEVAAAVVADPSDPKEKDGAKLDPWLVAALGPNATDAATGGFAAMPVAVVDAGAGKANPLEGATVEVAG